MLPITVCLFIAHAVASFEKRAPLFVLTLFLFEGLSNTVSVWYAYGAASLVEGRLPFGELSLLNDAFPICRRKVPRPVHAQMRSIVCLGALTFRARDGGFALPR